MEGLWETHTGRALVFFPSPCCGLRVSGCPRIRRAPYFFKVYGLPPVPAARQLGLAADSDRPQAEAAKVRSGPERVLPSYTPHDGNEPTGSVGIRTFSMPSGRWPIASKPVTRTDDVGPALRFASHSYGSLTRANSTVGAGQNPRWRRPGSLASRHQSGRYLVWGNEHETPAVLLPDSAGQSGKVLPMCTEAALVG